MNTVKPPVVPKLKHYLKDRERERASHLDVARPNPLRLPIYWTIYCKTYHGPIRIKARGLAASVSKIGQSRHVGMHLEVGSAPLPLNFTRYKYNAISWKAPIPV